MSAQNRQPVLYQRPCIYYTRYPDNGRVAHSAILRMSFAGRFLINESIYWWSRCFMTECLWHNYITERNVWWYYYGFRLSIAAAASAHSRSRTGKRPDDVNTLNSKNIQPISFKFYMRVDAPWAWGPDWVRALRLRYFAIEIQYPPMTRTTVFAAKWHS